MSTAPPLITPEPPHRTSVAGRLRTFLITGLLALAPSVITLWVLYKLLNWIDGLLGRYIKFSSVLGGHRIPGVGIVATLLLLLIVGWLVSMIGRWLGGRPLLSMWDHLLNRIPGVGILYGSTKSFGEAFVSSRGTTFKQVVLVPWPSSGIYRVGFIAARPSPSVVRQLGPDVEVVFIPHTPNPASGFVHFYPKSQVIYLDWRVEDGLKVIVSGGVLQPGVNLPPGAPDPRAARAGTPASTPAIVTPESLGAPRPQ
jgi:uncharacterized membrane protein